MWKPGQIVAIKWPRSGSISKYRVKKISEDNAWHHYLGHYLRAEQIYSLFNGVDNNKLPKNCYLSMLPPI